MINPRITTQKTSLKEVIKQFNKNKKEAIAEFKRKPQSDNDKDKASAQNANNNLPQSSTFDFKAHILSKNQENIELYNSEIKFLSIKKLNINSEAFIPKSKQA